MTGFHRWFLANRVEVLDVLSRFKQVHNHTRTCIIDSSCSSNSTLSMPSGGGGSSPPGSEGCALAAGQLTMARSSLATEHTASSNPLGTCTAAAMSPKRHGVIDGLTLIFLDALQSRLDAEYRCDMACGSV